MWCIYGQERFEMTPTTDNSREMTENTTPVRSKSNPEGGNGNLEGESPDEGEMSLSLSHHKGKRKKLEIACVYCRRSHMICDESRPCQRCIKRGIGHLCYDEPSNSRQRRKVGGLKHSTSASVSPQEESLVSRVSGHDDHVQTAMSSNNSPAPPMAALPDDHRSKQPYIKHQGWSEPTNPGLAPQYHPHNLHHRSSVLAQTLPYNQDQLFYSEHAGSEFSSLNEFLSMIDDPELVNGSLNNPTNDKDNAVFSANNNMNPPQYQDPQNPDNILSVSPVPNMFTQEYPAVENAGHATSDVAALHMIGAQTTDAGGQSHQPVVSDAARDKFFLTAADPTTEISPEERLKQVIKAKLDAGLLQPYNYAKGYGRLQAYMENYMNVTSRQRILKPLSIFRPAFRAIARTLKDVDLVLVEESFERMLLDYDRVFTSMAIPACLWRRTGEIYRGNKEFASLVGVSTDDLKDGKLAIYEVMSEESAVNFWEKYGAIAFDKGQKAVLTSCNLRTRDGMKRKNCCFSFTIRRDRYNIPSCIVGNFIPIDH